MAGKIDGDKIKYWWNSNGTKIMILIVLFLILTVFMVWCIKYYNSSETKIISSNNRNISTVSNNFNNSNSSSSSALDYSIGYDTGYQYGVGEAYTSDPYDDEFVNAMNESDMWKKGYKDGYTQGYNDIKDKKPLKRPKLSNNTYKDPRTGLKIQ